MKNEILRHIRLGKVVEIMYIDQRKQLTRRLVKLIRIEGEYVQAFCYVKRAPRMFKISNILAICLPIETKKAANQVAADLL